MVSRSSTPIVRQWEHTCSGPMNGCLTTVSAVLPHIANHWQMFVMTSPFCPKCRLGEPSIFCTGHLGGTLGGSRNPSESASDARSHYGVTMRTKCAEFPSGYGWRRIQAQPVEHTHPVKNSRLVKILFHYLKSPRLDTI